MDYALRIGGRATGERDDGVSPWIHGWKVDRWRGLHPVVGVNGTTRDAGEPGTDEHVPGVDGAEVAEVDVAERPQPLEPAVPRQVEERVGERECRFHELGPGGIQA